MWRPPGRRSVSGGGVVASRAKLRVVGDDTVVDATTGETQPDMCPGCVQRDMLIEKMEGELHGKRLQIANMERDAERDARQDPLWEEARELFDYWRKKCHHPRSRFDAVRFKLVLPYLKKDGRLMCMRAIRGAAYDPFITTNKNGTKEVHDDWELIFRPGRKQFEAFLRKAPEPVDPSELYRVATALLEEMPEDERPGQDRVSEAIEQAKALLEERNTWKAR
jgi:hypothetical protein